MGEWIEVETTPKERYEELIFYNMYQRRKIEKQSGARFFTNFVSKMYPDAKNILDVGVGEGVTSTMLKNRGFSVTAMDKNNSITTVCAVNSCGTTETFEFRDLNHNKRILVSKGIEFLEEYFTLDTDIEKYDLVVGLHACGANELIIRRCLEVGKEFVVTPCEIQKSIYNQRFINRASYIAYLRGLSEQIKSIELPIQAPNQEDMWGKTLYLKK